MHQYQEVTIKKEEPLWSAIYQILIQSRHHPPRLLFKIKNILKMFLEINGITLWLRFFSPQRRKDAKMLSCINFHLYRFIYFSFDVSAEWYLLACRVLPQFSGKPEGLLF